MTTSLGTLLGKSREALAESPTRDREAELEPPSTTLILRGMLFIVSSSMLSTVVASWEFLDGVS
jgi:hypothetical protein